MLPYAPDLASYVAPFRLYQILQSCFLLICRNPHPPCSLLMGFGVAFHTEILETNCKFFEYEMPLYAIGLTITAHQTHHFNVIKERYLPLDN